MLKYLIVVFGDIEPSVHGPYATDEDRDAAARDFRRNSPDDGVFPLDIALEASVVPAQDLAFASLKVEVSSYSGAFFEEPPPNIELHPGDLIRLVTADANGENGHRIGHRATVIHETASRTYVHAVDIENPHPVYYHKSGVELLARAADGYNADAFAPIAP